MRVSFSRKNSGLSIYHLFVRSNLDFLRNSQIITFTHQLCLILFSFWANLLYSIIDRFVSVITLSTSAILLRLDYFCLDLVLIALFCVAIRRDSVSLLRFLFLSQVQVFSFEISLFWRSKCPFSCFSYHFCFLIIFVLLMLV